jgi:Ni/Fe-hydrogenase subunit HybB-like protein
MLALTLVVIGVVVYRWDTNLSGQMVVLSYIPGSPLVAYTSYSPSLIELASTLGVVAYGILAFSLGVRYLNVVDHGRETEELRQPAAELVTAPASD